jgi:hypothetical protein
MPVENLQLHKEQDQQLYQTRREASPNKERKIRDFCIHQHQLHDLQRQEVQQQREDKDHPRLLGGADKRVNVGKICEEVQNLSANLAHDLVIHIAKEIVANITHDLVENSNQEMDSTTSGYYKAGLDFLKEAVLSHDYDIMKKNTKEASAQFICASVEGSGFMQAKSMFYTAVCCHLLGKRDTAMNWYEKAYQKGYEQGEKFIGQIHEMQKKGQIKYYFEKLVNVSFMKVGATDLGTPIFPALGVITGLVGTGASLHYTAQANEAIDKMKTFNNEFMVPLGNMLDSCPATSRRAENREYLSIPDKKHHWLSSILPGDFCCESKRSEVTVPPIMGC